MTTTIDGNSGGSTLTTATPYAFDTTAVPSGGAAGSGYRFSSTANFGVFFGSGVPTLSAARGSLYLRSDGAPYYNNNGTTGWTAVSSGGGGTDIVIGTTAIASGTTTRILYNNSSVVGEYTITGTGTVVAMAAGPTFTGTLSSANQTLTTASANAFVVGPAGTTNPVLKVDASTASQAAGLSLTGATSAGTVAVAVTSSGTDANLSLNAKGTGTIGIGSVSTGAVTITPATTITGALTLSAMSTFTAFNYAADAQANDTYVITLAPALAAYTTGQQIIFKANTANTGAASLNVNGLGAKTIVKRVNTTLANNDILAGMFCLVVYDGTNFVIMNPVVN